MKQEDKELLLKDLCARLPYGVICNDNRHGSGRVTNIDITPNDIEHKNPKVVLYYFDFDECGGLENCKPYLRPMSSMTEEEYDDMFHQLYLAQDEFFKNYSNTDTIGKIIGNDMVRYDWLIKKMFDFRCLIQKGLAIEAPEGMYK